MSRNLKRTGGSPFGLREDRYLIRYLKHYAVDESGEVYESGMHDGSGAINEFEIVESDEAHFVESEDISENYNGQEEHSDTSEYADSCTDSCNEYAYKFLIRT